MSGARRRHVSSLDPFGGKRFLRHEAEGIVAACSKTNTVCLLVESSMAGHRSCRRERMKRQSLVKVKAKAKATR